MRDEELESDIHIVKKGVRRLAEHAAHDIEIGSHYLGARDEVEDHWDELTPAEKEVVRRFDETVLQEIDWILEEEPFFEQKLDPSEDFDRSHWWWFLWDIKTGRMDPPPSLKGAA